MAAAAPADSVQMFRGRLARLTGLPLRPETARGHLLQAPHALTSFELDPAWALAQELGTPEPLTFVRDTAWWHVASADGRLALDRLWKHAVACRIAATRLAAGSPGTEHVGRLAFLQSLGYWLIGATAPELLAELLAAPRSKRRGLERARLGQEPTSLARDWLLRAPAPVDLVESVWLHEGPRLPGSTLRVVRKARAWADCTPWSLAASPPGPAHSGRARRSLRWLVAEVQSRCPGEFVAAPGDPAEVQLAQRLAAAQIEADLREHKLGALLERTDQLGSRLRRNETRSRQHDQLERLEALAEFAGGAGHELNNPLAVIMGRAQLLIGQTTGPEVHRSLRTIVAQAQRAHRILRDLMYVARPTPPRPRRCQPDALLQDAARDLSREAESRGISLHLDIADPPAWAWIDADALRHLADVLLRNALEASSRDQVVRVLGRSTPARLIWRIEDRGAGLNDRSARALFDPFYCGREAGRGLGLGLARAARFLEQQGGSIRWNAPSTGGMVFRVALPIEPMPESQPRPGSLRATA